MLVGEVRGSSSAGQSMTYFFILEAYISFLKGWEGFGVSKESLFVIVYIPNIFLLVFVVCTCFSRLCLHMCLLCVFVCAQMHSCTVYL